MPYRGLCKCHTESFSKCHMKASSRYRIEASANATQRLQQMPHRGFSKCHVEASANATQRLQQMPRRGCSRCHIEALANAHKGFSKCDVEASADATQRHQQMAHRGFTVVGSLKLQVTFVEYSLFYRALLQKRPTVLRSLLIVAIPQQFSADATQRHQQMAHRGFTEKEPCQNWSLFQKEPSDLPQMPHRGFHHRTRRIFGHWNIIRHIGQGKKGYIYIYVYIIYMYIYVCMCLQNIIKHNGQGQKGERNVEIYVERVVWIYSRKCLM